MIPILSVVGPKNSGKTTLCEALVRTLTRDGLRIATIKHDAHSFEVDHEGKDSYRLKHAGSRTTILASDTRVFVTTDVDAAPSLVELVARYVEGAGPIDMVLAEGFKQGPQPKIEVSRSATGKPTVATPETGLIATAADSQMDRGVPHFDLDDVEGIARFIRQDFLRDEFVPNATAGDTNVTVRVNGEVISINPFATKMFDGAVAGLVDALKLPEGARAREGRRIEIRIES